jgi:ABC-type transport system involved in cytochrome c biogenesis ATPase subunit
MTDDTDHTSSQDDQFVTNESTASSAVIGGRTGIGKTTRLAEMMAAIRDHDGTETEWSDPKNETADGPRGGD